MTQRIDISRLTPDGYRKVINLDGYASANVEPILRDLINLRVSLINGCTFCVDMHSVDLQAAGVPDRKIFSVTTWRESTFFTPREKAAFELAERITLISQGGVPDDVWERARNEFAERELADLVLAIGTINIWNRVAISTLMPTPPLEQAAEAAAPVTA
jgi:AhpD family alkylhydroperoxidase